MAVLAQRNGNSVSARARVPSFEMFPEFPRFARLIDAMMNASLPAAVVAEEAFVPAIDAYERDGNYVIEAALPGFRKDDLSIDVQPGQVTISGQYEEQKQDNKSKPRYSEIRRAAFTRTILLPREVDPQTAKATFENGLLSITLQPMSPKPDKKIEIQGT
jgi:HSP20 family protein